MHISISNHASSIAPIEDIKPKRKEQKKKGRKGGRKSYNLG
jgi:hypothetical protein